MLRRNNFQVGNIPWNKGSAAENGRSVTEDPVASYSSGSPGVGHGGAQIQLTNTAPIIDLKKRLDKDTYQMLYRPGDHVILPWLRSIKKKGYKERRSYIRNQVRGNRIVDMQKMEELMNLFNAGHRKANGRRVCKGDCKFSSKLEKKIGFGCKEALLCKACGYKTTPAELFQRADTRRPGTRGPLPVKLNIQAVTPGAKDRYGCTAIKPLFASMNIQGPSRTTLQKKLNVASKAYVELNEKQMEANCKTLAEVKRLRLDAGLKERRTVTVESDVAYNNPPKGRSMAQPGTQAECPFFEAETGKKMLVSVSTASQHCKKCEDLERQGLPSGPGTHDDCTRTFDTNKKLGASERVMAKQNTEKLLKHGLEVGIMESDNDAQIIGGTNDALREAGLEPAEKQDCMQHNQRNHSRRTYNLYLEVFEGGNNRKVQRQEASRQVGRYLVKKCTSALYNAGKLHGDNDAGFLDEIEQFRNTLVNCISGEHSSCSLEMATCPEHTPEGRHRRRAPEIPGGGNLALTEADRKALQAFIDYRLGPETAKRQRMLLTTNKSEAFHNRVLKAVPKAMTFKKNYNGRVHAAALGDSVGSGAAIRRANEFLGASHSQGSPGTAALEAIDREEAYHRQRRKTWTYRLRRYHLRQAKAEKRDKKGDSGYSTDSVHAAMSSLDHPYSKK